MTKNVDANASFGDVDTTHQNEQTLRHYFECFAKGDYRGMQSCLHVDVAFSDIGFDLRGRNVGAMWHMLIANGIQVSAHEIEVNGQTGVAHWECDYQFRRDQTAAPRPVHNTIESMFVFENGLIREQRDNCDFWTWFEQAMGPVGKGAHAIAFLENKLEHLVRRDIPLDVEQRLRAQVKEVAAQKIEAFRVAHSEYRG